MKSHRIKEEMIAELRTEVYLGKNFRLYVRAVAVDDRGKEYSQFVGIGSSRIVGGSTEALRLIGVKRFKNRFEALVSIRGARRE
jgi:hypothetical protein